MHIDEKDGKLVVSDFDELEAFKIACKIESDGIRFYKLLAEKIADDRINAAISFLLDQEEKHLNTFDSYLEQIKKIKEDMFEEDDLLTSIDYEVFWPYQRINNLDEIIDEPSKALRLGIIIEENAIRFYEACRELVSEPDTKNALSLIAEEEYKHKELLENILSNT